MKKLGIIILAAGEGKRMKSKIPKVLHHLCGKPMLLYVVDVGLKLKPSKIVIVISPKINEMIEEIQQPPIQYVIQDPPRGTGDAVLTAEHLFNDFGGNILILCGDVPLIKLDTLTQLIKFHCKNKGEATILTAEVQDPSLYGRIVRKGEEVVKIVEDKEASPKEKEIREINTGIYVFEKRALFLALHQVTPLNMQSEYYLTDTIEILCKKGKKVYTLKTPNWQEVLGINTRKALAEVERILQKKIIEHHQLSGVTIKNPGNTVIDFDVKIGTNTLIYPGVQLRGRTCIEKDCEIGANTIIIDSTISSETKIGENSTIKDAIL
jgi:bifunctional UDP-N-acetylglucosamine pyrophosphorylase/glucosamine-1-phosphate N-acetyltransferase